MNKQEALSHVDQEIIRLKELCMQHKIMFAAFYDSELEEHMRDRVAASPEFMADVIYGINEQMPKAMEIFKAGPSGPSDPDEFTIKSTKT